MTLDKILDHIRWKRQASGISLRQIARKLGRSPTYLSLVETGKSPKVTQQFIHEIGRILDLDQRIMDEWCHHCDVLPDDVQAVVAEWPHEAFAAIRSLKRAFASPPQEDK